MAGKAKATKATPPVPAINRWFKLAVDNDRDPQGVYRVKLVRLGYVHNLKDAREKADVLGWRLLEGQAREAMKAKYPVSNPEGPILFGGSEWQDAFGNARVATLDRDRGGWSSSFHTSFYASRRYRWAVVEKDA